MCIIQYSGVCSIIVANARSGANPETVWDTRRETDRTQQTIAVADFAITVYNLNGRR